MEKSDKTESEKRQAAQQAALKEAEQRRAALTPARAPKNRAGKKARSRRAMAIGKKPALSLIFDLLFTILSSQRRPARAMRLRLDERPLWVLSFRVRFA